MQAGCFKVCSFVPKRNVKLTVDSLGKTIRGNSSDAADTAAELIDSASAE
jgi:hypothetical protein